LEHLHWKVLVQLATHNLRNQPTGLNQHSPRRSKTRAARALRTLSAAVTTALASRGGSRPRSQLARAAAAWRVERAVGRQHTTRQHAASKPTKSTARVLLLLLLHLHARQRVDDAPRHEHRAASDAKVLDGALG
jgi:hypothetical protein